MKKLLISIVATASLALVAKADVLNSASFENYLAEKFSVDLDDFGAQSGDKYWSGGGTDPEFEWVTRGEGEGASKALSIDVEEELVREVKPDGTALDIGTGLYFDSMVQFTATEEAPVPTDGDKLIVWLKEIAGDTPTYKLCVTAAELNDEAEPTAKVFETSAQIMPETWNRLSIAAKVVKVGESNITEFKVYVNSTLLETGAPLYSLVPYTTEADDNGYYNRITSVSFKGKGAIDDLVWTTEDPYAPETKKLSVVVNDVEPDFATWTYSIDGGDVEYLVYGSNEIEVLQAATKIVFTCEMENGYSLENSGFTGVFGESTTTWTKEIMVAELSFEDALTFAPEKVEEPVEPVVKPFTVTIAGVDTPFETLAEAIEAANGVTIKLNQAATLTEKLTVAEAAVIDLNGQTLTLANDQGYAVVVKGALTIKDSVGGGEINVPGSYGFGIGTFIENIDAPGSLTVEGGSIIGEKAEYLIGVFVGNATIKGGNFKASYCCLNAIGKYDATGVLIDATCATATVTGGTFTVKETDPTVPWDIGAILGQDGCVAVSAGTFNVPLMDSLCAEGYIPTTEAVNGYYTVVEKADEKPTAGEDELEAEDFANPKTVNSTTEVTLPEGWTVSEDKTQILNKDSEPFVTFPSYYTATVVDGKIKLALNDTVKPVIAESKVGDTTVKPMEFAKEGEADVVKLNVPVRNDNLFYGVKAAGTLTGLDGATPAWATARGVNPPAVPKSGNAQFFRVVVTDVLPAQN